MDLDQDGNTDILSGSYSRMEGDMAGLFQVLWGRNDGTFLEAKPLVDDDGEPLLLPGDRDVDRICTRPFAADLNGDQHLDLVVGNYRGGFGVFGGRGKGRFESKASALGGPNLWVDSHGDPFLVDWDGDGDLDLLSGSAAGGVFLFPNEGSKTSPTFGKRVTLVKQPRDLPQPAGDVLGDAHLRGPGMASRVWADDIDGDGKLDLLVGDCVTLYHAAEAVSAAAALEKLAAWKKAVAEIPDGDGWSAEYERLTAQRDAFVTDESVGFVWLVRRK